MEPDPLKLMRSVLEGEVENARVWLLNEVDALAELARQKVNNDQLLHTVNRVTLAAASLERAEMMEISLVRVEQKLRPSPTAYPNLMGEIKPPRVGETKPPRQKRQKEPA